MSFVGYVRSIVSVQFMQVLAVPNTPVQRDTRLKAVIWYISIFARAPDGFR